MPRPGTLVSAPINGETMRNGCTEFLESLRSLYKVCSIPERFVAFVVLERVANFVSSNGYCGQRTSSEFIRRESYNLSSGS